MDFAIEWLIIGTVLWPEAAPVISLGSADFGQSAGSGRLADFGELTVWLGSFEICGHNFGIHNTSLGGMWISRDLVCYKLCKKAASFGGVGIAENRAVGPEIGAETVEIGAEMAENLAENWRNSERSRCSVSVHLFFFQLLIERL